MAIKIQGTEVISDSRQLSNIKFGADDVAFPSADGSNGQVLVTDGSGTLSFQNPDGGILSVVEDTTPQLGGDLDAVNNSLINVAQLFGTDNGGQLFIRGPNSTVANGGSVRVRGGNGVGAGNKGGNIIIEGGSPTDGATVYGNVTIAPNGGDVRILNLKYPSADGSNGQVLVTDGSGNLSFADDVGGISNLVEDTTPQLGGDLVLNGKEIQFDGGFSRLVGYFGNDVEIASYGNFEDASNPGNIYLKTWAEGGTRGDVIIQDLTYPQSDGTSGQSLITDGSGNLSFGTVTANIDYANIGNNLGIGFYGNNSVNTNSYDYIVHTSTGATVKVDPTDAIAGLLYIEEAIDASQDADFNLLMIQDENGQPVTGGSTVGRAAFVDSGGLTFNPATNVVRTSGTFVATQNVATTSLIGSVADGDIRVSPNGTGQVRILKDTSMLAPVIQMGVGQGGAWFSANNDMGIISHYGTSANTAATSVSSGTEYMILSQGTSDFTAVGAASNNAGTTFTATGTPTGDGVTVETSSLKKAFFGMDASDTEFKYYVDATANFTSGDIADRSVTGTLGYMRAAGYKTDGTTGFLRSDGTVDTSTYLTGYTESDTLATVTSRGASTTTAISITNTTASSSKSTGALIVDGGVGVGGNAYVGGDIVIDNASKGVKFTYDDTGDVLSIQNSSGTNVARFNLTPGTAEFGSGTNNAKIRVGGNQLLFNYAVGSNQIDFYNDLKFRNMQEAPYHNAMTIKGSDASVEMYNNLTVTGTTTASGFIVSGQSGFLKADGTVDTNTYLTGFTETVTSLTANSAAQELSYVDENGTTNTIDLSWAVDDTNLARITSGSVNGSSGVATFTRDDASTFTVDFSALFDDTNLTRITSGSVSGSTLTLSRSDATTVSVDVSSLLDNTDTTYSISAADVAGGKAIRLTAGGSGSGTDDVTLAAGSNVSLSRSGDTITINSTDTNTDTNNYVNNLIFNANTGVLTAARSGLIDVTVDLDGRYVDAAGAFNIVPTYTGSDINSITYNEPNKAIELRDSSNDNSVGYSFQPFRVNNRTGETFSLSITFKGSASDSNGIYFRVYEYDTELPAGKTHISNNAQIAQVQEDTSGKTDWYENGGISTDWVTSTYTYTPTAGAKLASIVILNWDGYTGSIYVKPPAITAIPASDTLQQINTDSSNSNQFVTFVPNDTGSQTGRVDAGLLYNPATNNLSVAGNLSASSKSFVIDHPTKEGMKLRYGSLEGPENGVYVRGRLKDNNTIELPDYWVGLIDEDTITVNLTSVGKHQKLYVKDIDIDKVIVGNDNIMNKSINCFYTVYAERNDIDKLTVEYTEA